MIDANVRLRMNRNCQKYIYKDERYVDITEIAFRDQKTSGMVLCTFHLFACLRIMDRCRWRIKSMLLRCGFPRHVQGITSEQKD